MNKDITIRQNLSTISPNQQSQENNVAQADGAQPRAKDQNFYLEISTIYMRSIANPLREAFDFCISCESFIENPSRLAKFLIERDEILDRTFPEVRRSLVTNLIFSSSHKLNKFVQFISTGQLNDIQKLFLRKIDVLSFNQEDIDDKNVADIEQLLRIVGPHLKKLELGSIKAKFELPSLLELRTLTTHIIIVDFTAKSLPKLETFNFINIWKTLTLENPELLYCIDQEKLKSFNQIENNNSSITLSPLSPHSDELTYELKYMMDMFML